MFKNTDWIGDLRAMVVMFVIVMVLLVPFYLLIQFSPEYAVYLIKVLASPFPERTLWLDTSIGFIFNWYAFPFYLALLAFIVAIVVAFVRNCTRFARYVMSGQVKELFDPQAMYEKHQSRLNQESKDQNSK